MCDSGAVQVPNGNSRLRHFVPTGCHTTRKDKVSVLVFVLRVVLCSVLQELITGAIGCMTYTWACMTYSWACELGYPSFLLSAKTCSLFLTALIYIPDS